MSAVINQTDIENPNSIYYSPPRTTSSKIPDRPVKKRSRKDCDNVFSYGLPKALTFDNIENIPNQKNNTKINNYLFKPIKVIKK